MAAKHRERTYYKVTFTNDDEMYQICARELSTSDLYGLIEIGDFIFPEKRLVYNPGEERLRREFEGIKRTWIPYHTIIRIDEIPESTEMESKIIPLKTIPKSGISESLKKPDA